MHRMETIGVSRRHVIGRRVGQSPVAGDLQGSIGGQRQGSLLPSKPRYRSPRPRPSLASGSASVAVAAPNQPASRCALAAPQPVFEMPNATATVFHLGFDGFHPLNNL